jgi:hypothetical protein
MALSPSSQYPWLYDTPIYIRSRVTLTAELRDAIDAVGSNEYLRLLPRIQRIIENSRRDVPFVEAYYQALAAERGEKLAVVELELKQERLEHEKTKVKVRVAIDGETQPAKPFCTICESTNCPAPYTR